MKRILLLAILFSGLSAEAQNWDTIQYCGIDTVLIERPNRMKLTDSLAVDTIYSFLAERCTTRASSGMRIDIGVSNYTYDSKTESWLGNHGGPNFGFVFFYNRFNFGLRFKPWTIQPNRDLEFEGQMLTDSAKLNPIKTDFYLGYSFDFKWNFSIEPYAGYTKSSFGVINEEDLGREYTFKKSGGLLFGATLNKYFKIGDYQYFVLTASGGYGMVDFSKTHPDLGKGYSEWNVGVAYKGAFKKKYLRKIEKTKR